jgi:replicative superfamily II helicase
MHHRKVGCCIDPTNCVHLKFQQVNSLADTAIEDGKMDELGIVVLEELHMMDDGNRGYIRELMITELLVLHQIYSLWE